MEEESFLDKVYGEVLRGYSGSCSIGMKNEKTVCVQVPAGTTHWFPVMVAVLDKSYHVEVRRGWTAPTAQ